MELIKFRWFRKQTNEMVYDLVTEVYPDGSFGTVEDSGHTVFAGTFTGCKDFSIHKKDIFTGDILSDKWIAEVYQHDKGTFMVRFHNNPKQNKSMPLFDYMLKRHHAGTSNRDCVVIGNIHQNPDLV